MNTEPLILMITVQSLVTIAMVYCFRKVIRKQKNTEK